MQLKKYCEACYRQTDNGIYIMYSRFKYAVHINHPMVDYYNDFEVFLTDGTSIKINVFDDNVAFERDVHSSKTLYLCSDNCLNNGSKILGDTVINYKEFNRILLQLPNPIFDFHASSIKLLCRNPVAIQKNGSGYLCHNCDYIHPNENIFAQFDILEKEISKAPPIDNRFNLSFKFENEYYNHVINNQLSRQFCSLACAGSYSFNNKVVLYEITTLDPNVMLIITPDSIELAKKSAGKSPLFMFTGSN
jgi:hypothetical protein